MPFPWKDGGMIRWITWSDFQDFYLHAKWSFGRSVFRVLRLTGRGRILSRWNSQAHLTINWYDVPHVVRYVQKNVTGDGNTPYARYLLEKFLPGRNGIRILSPGCGIGVKEFLFARLPGVGHIDAFDIAPVRIAEARRRADAQGLTNLRFFVGSIYDLPVAERYDIVLFDGCLHHFDKLDALMENVLAWLKPDGLLVIFEYTGPTRYQYSRAHVEKCNEALQLVPDTHRVFLRSSLRKNRIWAPGYLRMYLSDPSEGIRAGEILPAIRRRFRALEEKKVGGDLLAPVLKGTVHHYLKDDASNPILERLYEFERKYLAGIPDAHYTFGVYTPKSADAPHQVDTASRQFAYGHSGAS